jgi:hypothetical protein
MYSREILVKFLSDDNIAIKRETTPLLGALLSASNRLINKQYRPHEIWNINSEEKIEDSYEDCDFHRTVHSEDLISKKYT